MLTFVCIFHWVTECSHYMFSLSFITQTLKHSIYFETTTKLSWFLSYLNPCLNLLWASSSNRGKYCVNLIHKPPNLFRWLPLWAWRIRQVPLECLPSLVSPFWLLSISPFPSYATCTSLLHPFLWTVNRRTSISVLGFVIPMDNFHLLNKQTKNKPQHRK